MQEEIERKFWVEVAQLPPLMAQSQRKKEIRQSYLAVTHEREIRLRSVDGKRYFLTLKSKGGLKRQEVEIELTATQLREMKPLMSEWHLSKTRFLLAVEGRMVELDVYHAALSGLAVAEIEFKSESEARRFEPPSWCSLELTENDQFKNRELVGKHAGDLLEQLQKLKKNIER